MLVRNDGKTGRHVGGKLLHPGEIAEVPYGTVLGKGLVDVNATKPAPEPKTEKKAEPKTEKKAEPKTEKKAEPKTEKKAEA